MSLEGYSKLTASTKVITTLLVLLATLSNFIFNCMNYLQKINAYPCEQTHTKITLWINSIENL